ncbi:MAG TPA: hypothetical protein VN376_08220 [Longilinea sp.]|nr:hypothetical protein [Longilinea sp.]
MKNKWLIGALIGVAVVSFTGCSLLSTFQPTPTLNPTSTITITLTPEPTITPTLMPTGEWISSDDGYVSFQGIPGYISVKQGNLIASLSPGADLATGPVIAILHGSMEEMGLGSDLDEVAMNLIADNAFTSSSTSYSDLLGYNTVIVDYSTTIGETQLTGKLTLFMVGDTNLVIIIATTPSDEWSGFQTYLDQSINSIQIAN